MREIATDCRIARNWRRIIQFSWSASHPQRVFRVPPAGGIFASPGFRLQAVLETPAFQSLTLSITSLRKLNDPAWRRPSPPSLTHARKPCGLPQEYFFIHKSEAKVR
jgi:hypothetical protein